MLAEIGALAAFGYDRRAALWQIEKAVRPEGELFELTIADCRLRITIGATLRSGVPSNWLKPQADAVDRAIRLDRSIREISSICNLQSAIVN